MWIGPAHIVELRYRVSWRRRYGSCCRTGRTWRRRGTGRGGLVCRAKSKLALGIVGFLVRMRSSFWLFSEGTNEDSPIRVAKMHFDKVGLVRSVPSAHHPKGRGPRDIRVQGIEVNCCYSASVLGVHSGRISFHHLYPECE